MRSFDKILLHKNTNDSPKKCLHDYFEGAPFLFEYSNNLRYKTLFKKMSIYSRSHPRKLHER